jgi:hypothetical protein
LIADLRNRGILSPGDPLPEDRDLALLLIDTYERYPQPRPVS